MDGRPYLDLLLCLAERAAKEDDSEAEREVKSAFTLLTALITSAKAACGEPPGDAAGAATAAAIRAALLPQYGRVLALVGARWDVARSTLLRTKVRHTQGDTFNRILAAWDTLFGRYTPLPTSLPPFSLPRHVD